MNECDAALSHATPQSWPFYLTAYMRRALRSLDATILEAELPQGQAVRIFLEYPRDDSAKETYNQQDAKLVSVLRDDQTGRLEWRLVP